MSVNLGTTTVGTSTQYSNQHRIVETSDGKHVVFGHNVNSVQIAYKVSTDDGATFGSWVTVYNTPTVNDFDVYIDASNNILLAIGTTGQTMYFIKMTYGSGTWSIGSTVTASGAVSCYRSASITKRANGDIWIAGANSAETGFYGCYSTDGGATWSQTAFVSAAYTYQITIIPKGSDIWAFSETTTGFKYFIYTSSWNSGTVITTSFLGSGHSVGKVSDSEIYLAGETSSGIKVYKYTGTWDAGQLITGAAAGQTQPALSIITGVGPVLTYCTATPFNIVYSKYNGSSWPASVNITNDSATNKWPTAIASDTGELHTAWITGTSTYVMYFQTTSFVTVVQQTQNSDAVIKVVHQQTKNSDATIFVTGTQQTHASDAVITHHVQQTASSDAKIKVTGQQKTKSSDAVILQRIQSALSSNANIKVTGKQQQTTSDAVIIAPILYDILNTINFAKQALYDAVCQITTVKRILTDIANVINTAKGTLADTLNDFRMRGLGLLDIGNDVRFLNAAMIAGNAGIQSLGKTYIRVYFNSIEQTDVDVDSIEIHKILNGAHTASLDLGRAYDASAPALETTVTIYYSNYLLYKGYITEINPDENPEKINIICQDTYWKNNRDNSYFFVGHNPIENVPPNVVETYYDTPQQAIQTEFAHTVDFGNFVPQTIDCFGVGNSDALTSLIDGSGNYAWYYDVDDSFKIWRAGAGSIITINRQTLGQNLNLFHLINHQFKKDAGNVVNRYRVQMGNIYYVGNREYSSYSYRSYAQFATPAWDATYERLSDDDPDGEGIDAHSTENEPLYADVFKKYNLPYLDPKLEQYSDRYPPYVEIYSPDFTWETMNVFTELLTLRQVVTEGFTIDYENQTITFNEPKFLYQTGEDGEPTVYAAPIIKVYIWKKELHSFTDDPTNNPLTFYTSKVGSYPVTVTKELNLADLNKSTGVIYKFYEGHQYIIPAYDDTEFAEDYAYWQLSKTREEQITGLISITLDNLCFNGIDLTKRIYIDGITDSAMNIKSIDIRIADFQVSLQLENSQAYQRTVSFPWHGE